jgi:HAD superfamily phosphatase
MYTIAQARQQQPDRTWIAVGVLPPHVQDGGERQAQYTEILQQAGAAIVLANVEDLTPATIAAL